MKCSPVGAIARQRGKRVALRGDSLRRGACPDGTSVHPAAVAHQFAMVQLIHLASRLDAARGDPEPVVRRGQRSLVEPSAHGEAVTVLTRQEAGQGERGK